MLTRGRLEQPDSGHSLLALLIPTPRSHVGVLRTDHTRATKALRRIAAILTLALLSLPGCTDDDSDGLDGIGGVVTVLDGIVRDNASVSMLIANMQGRDSTYGPWRDRWARLPNWL